MRFYFVDLLRCVATTLITNSHYNEIWPVAAMATGGRWEILYFLRSRDSACHQSKAIAFLGGLRSAC